jgi:hypothetical protein
LRFFESALQSDFSSKEQLCSKNHLFQNSKYESIKSTQEISLVKSVLGFCFGLSATKREGHFSICSANVS